MNTTIPSHPTEEELCGCAIGDCSEETLRHLETCAECRDFVDSIRSISDDITNLDDESVPVHLDEAVKEIAGREKTTKLHQTFIFWSINPLSIGVMAILLLLALSSALVYLAR